MTPQDFVYWLNGHVELGGDKTVPTEAQWKMICEHLKLTMTKVTSPLGKTSVDPEWLKALEDIYKKLDMKADKFNNPGWGQPGVVSPTLPHPSIPGQFEWPFNQQPIITC